MTTMTIAVETTRAAPRHDNHRKTHRRHRTIGGRRPAGSSDSPIPSASRSRRPAAWRERRTSSPPRNARPSAANGAPAGASGDARGAGTNPSDRIAEGIGREIAHLKTLRRMSVSVAGMLQAGQAPATEAAVVQALGTHWEQALPRKARLLPAPRDAAAPPNGTGYAQAMYFHKRIAPKPHPPKQ